MKMNLSRIYREVVKLKEKEFSRREKHINMNATSKLLNQRSNQHVKLSKHLSTYMQSVDKSKNMSHKSDLLSCALRCSSKLQEIQSLENFVLMAIQGTQVPIYTNAHCFLYFSILFFIFYEKKNKTKPEKQLKKNIKKHTKHKTRLTQKLESRTNK